MGVEPRDVDAGGAEFGFEECGQSCHGRGRLIAVAGDHRVAGHGVGAGLHARDGLQQCGVGQVVVGRVGGEPVDATIVRLPSRGFGDAPGQSGELGSLRACSNWVR